MRVISSSNNIDVVLRAYRAVLNGPEAVAREQRTRNLSNVALIFDAREPIVTNFRLRDMNLAYAKREWLWYLGADPKDDSIVQYAKMWQKLKQPDGSFYSNYGQYIFAASEGQSSQFAYVVRQLKTDPQTRRASIVLLKREHLFAENTDTVCTYAINFSIEGNALNMTVMMRSNDIVFGLTNDAFCFSQLYEFVYQLVSQSIAGLVRGSYTHFTNSLHVYERHYDMLRAITASPNGEYILTRVPRPTPEEVARIVTSKGKEGDGEYYTWLTSFDR